MFDRDNDARQQSQTLFPLGRTVATRGVMALMQEGRVNPAELLARHESGDWGDLDAEDVRANEQAVTNGDRILSAYYVDTEKYYVVTEFDRSYTTVLLASEY